MGAVAVDANAHIGVFVMELILLLSGLESEMILWYSSLVVSQCIQFSFV